MAKLWAVLPQCAQSKHTQALPRCIRGGGAQGFFDGLVPGSTEVVMSPGVAEIEAKIRSLSLEDKTELLRVLIAELDGPADADVERAWLVEAQRRYCEVREGRVPPVPGEDVFENVRARLNQ